MRESFRFVNVTSLQRFLRTRAGRESLLRPERDGTGNRNGSRKQQGNGWNGTGLRIGNGKTVSAGPSGSLRGRKTLKWQSRRVFGSDVAVVDGSQDHKAAAKARKGWSIEQGDPQGKAGSGRRQGGSQDPMRRPRLSTWRLFLLYIPNSAKLKRGPQPVGHEPRRQGLHFRVCSTCGPSDTLHMAADQQYLVVNAAWPATIAQGSHMWGVEARGFRYPWSAIQPLRAGRRCLKLGAGNRTDNN